MKEKKEGSWGFWKDLPFLLCGIRDEGVEQLKYRDGYNVEDDCERVMDELFIMRAVEHFKGFFALYDALERCRCGFAWILCQISDGIIDLYIWWVFWRVYNHFLISRIGGSFQNKWKWTGWIEFDFNHIELTDLHAIYIWFV